MIMTFAEIVDSYFHAFFRSAEAQEGEKNNNINYG